MKRRLAAVLLVCATLISLLSGCGNQAADGFYDLWDEMAQVKDAELDLTLAYHGAELRISGFVSRTNETADLFFDLEGTGETDGTWTELRINGNQLWLNVAQLADFTLGFDLPASRKEDIAEFRSEQTGAWVNYTWEGDLWDGMPEWEELLTQLWKDTRPDLERSVTATESGYLLTLTGAQMEQTVSNVTSRMEAHREDYRNSFVETAERQSGIMTATQLEPDHYFDAHWNDLFYPDEDSAPSLPASAVLTLDYDEGSYRAVLKLDGSDVAGLTLTPVQPRDVSAPEDVMDFRAYIGSIHYLITFSQSYISDVLDGVEPSEEAHQDVNDDHTEYFVDPMATGAVQGYDDLAAIQFRTYGGTFYNLPVFTGFVENDVESINDDGVQITRLGLTGISWTQTVYTEATDETADTVVSDAINYYYNIYINTNGCLLVQDISDQSRSADGTVTACGFSYRDNDYAQPEACLILVQKQPDGSGFTVIDMAFELSEMTDREREMVSHLFEALDVDLPILLDVN